jgi:glucose dehydrogenase
VTDGARSLSDRAGACTYDTADPRRSKYSPLDQITATNFHELDIARRAKACGTRRSVVALDAKTRRADVRHSP